MASRGTLRHGIVLSVALTLHALARAQTAPKPAQRQLGRLEDEVSRLFEAIRAKDGLPPLTRINHRQSLQQLVCSAAALNAPVWRENRPAAVMYRTGDPRSASQGLEQIAAYKDALDAKGQPRITRYAVAVWQSSSHEDDVAVYWVGVQVYTSAWWEFIDSNFTDDRPYRNDWKRLVAPQCRDAQ
jgi:hypothetical protein